MTKSRSSATGRAASSNWPPGSIVSWASPRDSAIMWPSSSTGVAAARREPAEQRADAVRAVVGRGVAGRSDVTTPTSSCSVPTRHRDAGLPARREVRRADRPSSGPGRRRVRRRGARGPGTLGGDPQRVNRLAPRGSVAGMQPLVDRPELAASANACSSCSARRRSRSARSCCRRGEVELLHRLQAGQPRRRGRHADRRAVPRRDRRGRARRRSPSAASRSAPIRSRPRPRVVSFLRGRPRAAFLVRKEPKGHGTNQWLESTGLPAGAAGRDRRGRRHDRRVDAQGDRARAAGRPHVVHAHRPRRSARGRPRGGRPQQTPLTTLFTRRDFLPDRRTA